MDDVAYWARFQNIRDLVQNLRSVLPPLSYAQSQLVGLYLLNAVYLGEGEDFTTFPTLDREKPRLRLITNGAMSEDGTAK